MQPNIISQMEEVIELLERQGDMSIIMVGQYCGLFVSLRSVY